MPSVHFIICSMAPRRRQAQRIDGNVSPYNRAVTTIYACSLYIYTRTSHILESTFSRHAYPWLEIMSIAPWIWIYYVHIYVWVVSVNGGIERNSYSWWICRHWIRFSLYTYEAHEWPFSAFRFRIYLHTCFFCCHCGNFFLLANHCGRACMKS